MISSWPVPSAEDDYPEEEKHVEILKEAIRSIRSLRTDMNVSPGRKAAVHVVSEDAGVRGIFLNALNFFKTLSFASEVRVEEDKSNVDDSMVSAVNSRAVIYIPLADLVDVEKEKERLNKELARLSNEIARSEGMLKNENFLAKAPKEKVDAEREKVEKNLAMREEVRKRLAALG